MKNIILFVTNRCNAGCEHCFYHSKLNQPVEEVTIDELKKLLNNIKTDSITLTGGEPFVRDDLLEMCKLLDQHGIKRISITSNGFLTEKIYNTIKKILENVKTNVTLNLSLDGLEKTHDKIRNLNGCFSGVITTAKKIKPFMSQYPNFDMVIRTVVTKHNYNELESLSDYVDKELGILHEFELVRGPSTSGVISSLAETAAPKDAEVLLSNNDLDNIYKILRKIFKKRSKNSLIKKVRQATQLGTIDYNIKILKKRKNILPCTAGTAVGVIYPNSDIALCELMKPVGNLREREFNFSKIWNNEKANEQRKNIHKCFCTHGCFVGEEILRKSRNPFIRFKNFVKLL